MHLVGFIYEIKQGCTVNKTKFGNAKQAKSAHQYKNIKTKLYKTNAAVWYNGTCKYQCRKDSAIFLLMMGTWMPKTRREDN